MSKQKKCKNCKGTGMIQIGPNIRGVKTCPICKGKGTFSNNENIRK